MSQIYTEKVDALIEFLQRLREGCYVQISDGDVSQVYRLGNHGHLQATHEFSASTQHWELSAIDLDDLTWCVSRHGIRIVYRPDRPASQKPEQPTHVRRVEL